MPALARNHITDSFTRAANDDRINGGSCTRTKYVYDSYGYLNETKDNAAGTVFWQLNTANDASLPTLETLGNTVQVATSYTSWTNEMVTRTEGSGGSTTNLQNLTYNWDLAGNLHNRIDNRQGLTEQFGYDSMNRLLSSTLNGSNNLTLTYDAAGNITKKTDVSSSPYVYDTAHPHAVKTAGSWSMTYDADGNMIARAGGSISWYSYNLPNTISYSGNSTQFFYNASHQRWKQVASYSGTAETTHYIGGLLEIMTRGSNPTEYRHQIAAGSSTAVYTRRTDGSTSTYYATSDHLGSSDLVMDSSANVLARESFTPFGARRGSTWTGAPTSGDYTAFGNTTRKGFTGHEMLDSVALVHMNGRVYDPYLGRFLSADTVIQNLGATESINPYAYAWNDPLRYVDPSGHSLLGDIVGLVLAVVSFFTFQPELLSFWGVVADAAFSGFVGGFFGACYSVSTLSAALSAGLVAGVTTAAFAVVGFYADGPESKWTIGDRVLAHAAVGCFAGAAASGNCGKGALTAAVSEYLGSQVLHGNEGGLWGKAFQTVKYALIGGLVSRLEHESFDDGFTLGAAGYLFNEAFQHPGAVSISQEGVDAIKHRESFSADVYEDQGGHLTVGYGHMLTKSEIEQYEAGTLYQEPITRDDADVLLRHDLMRAVNAVNSLVTAKLTQRQFDALVSFVYNVGRDPFATSELRTDLNAGNYSAAASQMLRWEFVKIAGDGYLFSGGLANRRIGEMSQFSGVPWGP